MRYRGKYVLDFFKSNYGVNSYLILPSHRLSTVLFFIRAYLSALIFPKKDSLVVIQSVYTKSLYAAELKLLVRVRKQICIYDLDDADYLRYPPENIYWFLKNCSAVTLGSSELVKNLSKYNKRTLLITCPVPDLKIVKQEKNKVLTIGWIGDFTKGHKQSLLETFFPALIDLPFAIKLILVGAERKEEYKFLLEYFKDNKNIDVEILQGVDWQNEISIQQRIATFDVGIATLIDTEFYRSKSAFKLKQYLNNGVPVLSSNIAENNVFIEHGSNGFLCDTPGDFRNWIIEFNNMSAEDYKLFSVNARKSVHNFDLANYCNKLEEVPERTKREHSDRNF